MLRQRISYKPEDISVVLLAAGHGKRMLPLTKSTPKPLLKVGKHSLIEHHLIRLAKFGFKNIVINLAYLGNQIQSSLNNGSQYGLNINYSDESKSGALETAGGLRQALPLIKSNPFMVVNADIYTDYPFDSLLTPLSNSARLVMIENPAHNPSGDFDVTEDNKLTQKRIEISNSYTFSGIALYQQSIFSSLASGKQALKPVFDKLIASKQVEAVIYQGQWTDVGTPERLQELNERL